MVTKKVRHDDDDDDDDDDDYDDVCVIEGFKNSCSISYSFFPSSAWMGYR